MELLPYFIIGGGSTALHNLLHMKKSENEIQRGYAEIGKTRADNSKSGAMFDVFPEKQRIPPDEDIEVI